MATDLIHDPEQKATELALMVDLHAYSLGGARLCVSVEGHAAGFTVFLPDASPVNVMRAGYVLTSIMTACGTQHDYRLFWSVADDPLCRELERGLCRFPLHLDDGLPEISNNMRAIIDAVRNVGAATN